MNQIARKQSKPESQDQTTRVLRNVLPYVALARPDHWFKNLFALPGVGLAMLIAGLSERALYGLLAGIPAMCLIASANYVINEWIDRDTDGHHPTKRSRPSVTGRVNRRTVVVEYILLAAIGLCLSRLVGPNFFWVSVVFLVQGLIYNVPPIRTKDRVYLDVISESVNNPLRFMWGWYAVSALPVPSLSLLTGYWLAGAFLMSLKRYAEFRSIDDPLAAALYRKSFGRYTEERLLIMAMFCSVFAAFLLGVFMASYRIELILAFPFFSVLFAEYLRLGMQTDSPAQAPERLYRQRRLMAILVATLVIVAALAFIEIPGLRRLLAQAPLFV